MRRVIGIAAVALGALFGGLQLWGSRLRSHGQDPLDADAVDAAGGRIAVTRDGRRVEYHVYGSSDPRAAVVVNVHGSGLEARFERDLHAPICRELGVRGIAISLPGCGFTDMKPGRRVIDWANEDLTAVLDAEGVGQFMITGHSQGTPHAMAAAHEHPDRCTGLGLNAPLLPTRVCREEGLQGALGEGTLFTTTTLAKPFMGWYFAVYHVGIVTLGPWPAMRTLTAGRPKLKEDADLIRRSERTVIRSVARGSVGGAWETAGDVCYDWGFDPRAITVENVCVWHARDDNMCPPEPGRWLAEHWGAREGVRVDFRDDDEGYGHMTFCRGKYTIPETSMVASLLAGQTAN